jgi:uncharacterized protein YeeX (DUF496 family)
MKIQLPENIKDITLAQYQRYEKLNEQLNEEELSIRDYNKRKIDLFTGIPYHKVDNVSEKDLKEVMAQIDKALEQDVEFKSVFTHNGKEFGMIPNLDEITAGEYFDLDKYGVDVETLHNLMAILFRPVTRSDGFGNYEIETYEGTGKYADEMKGISMDYVSGVLVFFCHLSNELERSIQKSTVEAQAKDNKRQTILQNGNGTAQSTHLQKETY